MVEEKSGDSSSLGRRFGREQDCQVMIKKSDKKKQLRGIEKGKEILWVRGGQTDSKIGT